MRRLEGEGPNPSGICQCGCGQPAPIAKRGDGRLGWVMGKPLKYILGHNVKKWSPAYIVDPETGCWVWQRCDDGRGYGTIRRKGRGLKAHRYYYEMHKGPIPEGMALDHLCRNPACVNPDHLEPVTCRENVYRGVVLKLTDEDVREIRRLYAEGHLQAAIAKRYGVASGYISRLVNHKARPAA